MFGELVASDILIWESWKIKDGPLLTMAADSL